MEALVQLRPQFGHLDALNEAKKIILRSERFSEKRDNVEQEPEARAVNMAVKSTEGGNEEEMYGGMKATAKILGDMRDEPWQRLAWVDQDVTYVNNYSGGSRLHFTGTRVIQNLQRCPGISKP